MNLHFQYPLLPSFPLLRPPHRIHLAPGNEFGPWKHGMRHGLGAATLEFHCIDCFHALETSSCFFKNAKPKSALPRVDPMSSSVLRSPPPPSSSSSVEIGNSEGLLVRVRHVHAHPEPILNLVRSLDVSALASPPGDLALATVGKRVLRKA